MKEEIARSIMSDEAWDMVWEGLKEYCKINGMAEIILNMILILEVI